MKLDLFVSDLILGSSRCGRNISDFIATLEYGVSSTIDNNCCLFYSLHKKPGLLLLRTEARVISS